MCIVFPKYIHASGILISGVQRQKKTSARRFAESPVLRLFSRRQFLGSSCDPPQLEFQADRMLRVSSRSVTGPTRGHVCFSCLALQSGAQARLRQLHTTPTLFSKHKTARTNKQWNKTTGGLDAVSFCKELMIDRSNHLTRYVLYRNQIANMITKHPPNSQTPLRINPRVARHLLKMVHKRLESQAKLPTRRIKSSPHLLRPSVNHPRKNRRKYSQAKGQIRKKTRVEWPQAYQNTW